MKFFLMPECMAIFQYDEVFVFLTRSVEMATLFGNSMATRRYNFVRRNWLQGGLYIVAVEVFFVFVCTLSCEIIYRYAPPRHRMF